MPGSDLRLAALGLWHEANTFSPLLVDAQTMADAVLVGDAIVERYRSGTSTMSGFLAARSEEVAVVPLVMTSLVPRGRITADALRERVDDIVERLSNAGPFHGVLAALHGAAVAEGCDDVDGYLLRRIREVVGPEVPIGVALDLHANISEAMCAHVDAINTYRTNPHLDAHTTAREIADLVVAAARGEVAPTVSYVPIPAVINILRQNTERSPMREIIAAARAAMDVPGILSASVAEGFPYADVGEMGMSVVVVSDGDTTLGHDVATQLAATVWEHRREFEGEAPTADAAVAAVLGATAKPVLLLDVGDNIGGGSGGDSVVILRAARRAGLANLLTIVSDAAAVERCERAGLGAVRQLTIGGRSYPAYGPPIDASCVVIGFDDGLLVTGERSHGGMNHLDAGRSAAVRLDTGQTVILTSKVAPPFTIEQVTRFGLDPTTFDAIVAKGVHSPLATYLPYVADAVFVDTPGPTAADLGAFEYQRRPRPLFPFEPVTFSP